ncbi:uncharacterized protein LOC134061671 [Sardina pilchardus]|uniref:uncharacterized protein LOC134061671 n=1 Tax=Sardina pilchardus TaxID=27697 RepID=UPI002E119702
MPYFRIQTELSEHDECIIRGTHRVVVPRNVQPKLIQIAHDTHQGIVRTKQRLRELYWWPGMDADVQAAIKSCVTCAQHDKTAVVRASPLNPVRLPDSAWEKLAIDIVGPYHRAPPDCRYAITLVDYYSKWPEVAFTSEVTSATVIKFLSTVFSREGNPLELVTDNGSAFVSAEFDAFLASRDIKHCRSAVYYPQCNGEVERLKVKRKRMQAMEGYTRRKKICEDIDMEYMEYMDELDQECKALRTENIKIKEDIARLSLQEDTFRANEDKVFSCYVQQANREKEIPSCHQNAKNWNRITALMLLVYSTMLTGCEGKITCPPVRVRPSSGIGREASGYKVANPSPLLLMFHVVEFLVSKEVEVIHSNWLSGGQCFWPPFVSLAKAHKAVKDGMMPGANWTQYSVRVMYSHDVYESACAKLLDATVTSDLNTEDEDSRPAYMKRKNRGCKRISSSEEEEEEEEEQGRTAAPRAPTKKKSYATLAAAPCIPSFGDEWSQSAGCWSTFASSSAAGPCASHSSSITAMTPPPINSPVAGHCQGAAAGRSQLPGPTRYQHTPPAHGTWSVEEAVPTSQHSGGGLMAVMLNSPVAGHSQGLGAADTPTHAAAGRSQHTPPAHGTANRSQETLPTAIAKEILVRLDSIREQQLLILAQLQKISSGQAITEVMPDPTHFGLPLSTIEELQRLEETLNDPDEKKNLTILLGMVGGMSLKDTVGRVMKRIMNTLLAKTMNWSGANQKPAFKRLILKSVVLDAVRRNALTKESSEKEIEVLITRWLQLASDRDGGRSQRANRQTI